MCISSTESSKSLTTGDEEIGWSVRWVVDGGPGVVRPGVVIMIVPDDSRSSCVLKLSSSAVMVIVFVTIIRTVSVEVIVSTRVPLLMSCLFETLSTFEEVDSDSQGPTVVITSRNSFVAVNAQV